MSIKIRVLQFKRGLLDRLMAAGSLPGEPTIAWDDDTKPRLLIGDRMGVPRELAASAHVHLISSITGLQAALDSKAWAGGGIAWNQLTEIPGVAAFTNNAGYLTAINGAMVVDALGFTPAQDAHSHTIPEVEGLQAALDGKAAAVHGHAILDVMGLQSALDAKNHRASLVIPLSAATGTVDLGRSFHIEGEAASGPGRFRMYRTAAGRDADLGRAAGTDAPLEVGLLLEDAFTASALAVASVPAPGAPSGGTLCAWSWDGATGATVTLDLLVLEAN